MVHPDRQRRFLALPLVLAAMVVAIACGDAGPQFTPETAAALITEQWPESELVMSTAHIGEDGRGVAVGQFDGETWEFYFQPQPENGWVLEAVMVDGGTFYLQDLQQTSQTMQLMHGVAGALEQYRAAHGAYPEGDSPQALALLVPDYIAADIDRQDAWQEDFAYESDGNHYTMSSKGADKQMGTDDDINLHDGEFVGASQRQ